MRKKKLPEYEIVEFIKEIENPEKDYILKTKELMVKIFDMRGDKDGND